jgi:tetratricopeptide (TPR) repeat protein
VLVACFAVGWLGVGVVPDQLVVDLGGDGQVAVLAWPATGMPEQVACFPLAWPLDADALEDLRWYLEDYLLAPFGVWEERGPAVGRRLAGWGNQVFGSVFGAGPARDAYQRARDQGLEVVFRSAEPGLLGLPWELMRDAGGPVALGTGGISRSLPVAAGAGAMGVPGGRLRVLMVISRPAGTRDVGYQLVARPLMERLEAVRGEVELTVLRPPTFDALARTVRRAAEEGEPFHVVHFDGHGVMPGRATGGTVGGLPATGSGEGVLAFELPGWGSHHVRASKVAAALAGGRVPVVVLNACQSGAMGKELEASVATALLTAGCAAVVAMAYSVYAVAAAEFMAAFYESLFAGDSASQAVTAGRRRLFGHDGRPSPKGDMPLADWLVPVHYTRAEVRFPDARTRRPATKPPLDAVLDEIRTAPPENEAVQDSLAAAGAFVGRDDLFYQLDAAARPQRVVVLTGAGGTGKTELAKGFARWWRDTGGVDDPRLVLWHSFEPGVASFGLDGVINEVGLTMFGIDFARQDPPQRLAAVQQLLSQNRALLVWDNFESVREMPDPAGVSPPLDEGGCARLRDFLAWVRDHSASTALITSRAREEWLGDVRRIPVGGLNRAEAAQYAGHLLAPFPAAQRRRERRSFGELLEWLDGHPLAMRLTLPRLDKVGPAVLLAGLRSTTPLPAEDAGEGRLSSLGACITYSFTHLPEGTRRLLPAVSLFHGVADADVLAAYSAAEGVPGQFAGISGKEWSAVLRDATRVGLLTSIGAGMYRIHPALPGYLAAGWQAENPGKYGSDRAAAEQALRAACATFSEWLTGQIASGEAAMAYSLTGLQQQTLAAMLGHALDHHAWGEAARIVRALDDYWETRGLGEEIAAWGDRILAATAGPGRAVLEAAHELWLYTLGRQASRLRAAGQLDQAARAYRQALAWLLEQPESGWARENIATVHHQLGITAQAMGQVDEAEDWHRKALTLSEDVGHRPGMASTYHGLGNTAYLHGRLDEAEDWYRKSLTISEDLDDRPSMAPSYHQLGMTAEARGRLDEAGDWYRKSLTISQDLGNRPGMVNTYHQLGNTAYQRGRLDEAEDWYRKSLTISEDLDDRPGIARSYHQLGMTAEDRGRLDEAEDWYRKSLTISEGLGSRPGMARSYHQLGMTAQDRGRLDEAEDWYHKALTVEEGLGDRRGMARSYHQLGNTAYLHRRLDEAEDWYRKALTISEDLTDRRGMAGTYAQLGMIAMVGGRLDEAEDWYRRSLTISEDLTDGPGTAGTYAQLGMTAMVRGRLDEAEGWYRKALTISQELGNRPRMANIYWPLGLIAEVRGEARQALTWNIRCVTLFSEFPSSLTGQGPSALARLTRQLGMPALEEAWQQATGQPVPQSVRDYITSHHDQPPPGGQP